MYKTNKYFLFSKILFFIPRRKLYLFYKKFSLLKYLSFWYKGFKKYDLIIIDNLIPSQLSPWRSFEFSELCKEFPSSLIYCDLESFRKYSLGNNFRQSVAILEKRYPAFDKKLIKLKKINFISSNLAYFLFYQNIDKYFNSMVKLKQKFIFTLFPGGGFELFNESLNQRLKTICFNELCKGVIVNQFVTRNYLIENNICPNEKIKLIHGVPINVSELENNISYNKDLSSRLNVLFMANRYTSDGADKGFPIFIEFVQKAVNYDLPLNFVVVGNYSEMDINKSLVQSIQFKGLVPETEFCDLFSNIHIIISPNQPFMLKLGGFDGFPLATCVSACLHNVLVMATDYFNESEDMKFVDGKHYINIQPISLDLIDKINLLLEDRNRIAEIVLSGKEMIIDHYSYSKQIVSRLNFFRHIINNS